MEQPTQTLYNLESEIAAWRQNMLNGALTPEDAEELTQHLRDEMSALQAKGLSGEEAWLVARKRIGQPLAINEEFSKVNPDFAASRNLLMLFWGGTIFMVLQTLLFAFPNLLWFIVLRFSTRGHIDHVLSDGQVQILLYSFSLLILFLAILNLTRAGKIALWFNKLITNSSGVISLILIIAGLFIGTINYIAVTAQLNSHGNAGWSLGNSLELLGFLFYGSLIFCTAWFTIRYKNQEFRNIKIFAANINWVTSLGLGILLIVIATVGNLLNLHLLTIVITAALFIPAGWLIGNSKTRGINLFMLQAFAMMLYWYTDYNSAHRTFAYCFTEHSIVIVAMFMGFFISKHNQAQLQTT